MARVKVLKYIPGQPYMAGDVVEVSAEQAKRWIATGYAEAVAVKVKSRTPARKSRKRGTKA